MFFNAQWLITTLRRGGGIVSYDMEFMFDLYAQDEFGRWSRDTVIPTGTPINGEGYGWELCCLFYFHAFPVVHYV
jgi:hypothetical protein